MGVLRIDGPDPADTAKALAWARSRVPPAAPAPSDRHLRRLLGCGTLCDPHAFEVMAALPEDWIPRGDEEEVAFLRVAQRLRTTRSPARGTVEWGRADFVHLLGGYGFLHASRGRWIEYENRFPSLLTALHDEMRGIVDMVMAFSVALVVPVLFRARLCDERYDYDRRSVVAAIAARVLLADKSLHAILETSAEWHRVSGLHAVKTTSPWMAWPTPFERAQAPNGLSLACLPDAEALTREGLAMHHCVGGYGHACAAGRSVIVSVRGAGGERLSTIELTPLPDDRFALAQNLGHRNGAAPASSVEAGAWLAATLGTPGLPVPIGWLAAPASRRSRPEAWLDTVSETSISGAAARWGPLLPRPQRTREGLEAAIGRAALDVLRSRLPAGTGVRPDGGLVEGNVPWTGDPPPVGKMSFQVEAFVRMRAASLPPFDRRRLSRLADVGWLPLLLLACLVLATPLVPVLGRRVLIPAILLPALAPALLLCLRTGPGARWARRRWELRAEALAGKGMPGRNQASRRRNPDR